MKKAAIGVSLLCGLAAPAHAAPPLVSAYLNDLARTCGVASPSASLVERLDLNGDKIDDYVIDDSRQPCPSRPAEFAVYGSRVTIFIGREDGQAYPAMQLDGFGASLERKATGGYGLWVTLGGSNCGSDNAAERCRREVVWRGPDQGLELATGSSNER